MIAGQKVVVVMPAFNAGETLEQLPLHENSDDFVFDNEILAETAWYGYVIGEVSCPTRYAPDASSINFARSVRYGFGCLATACVFRLCRWCLASSKRFRPEALTRS